MNLHEYFWNLHNTFLRVIYIKIHEGAGVTLPQPPPQQVKKSIFYQLLARHYYEFARLSPISTSNNFPK